MVLAKSSVSIGIILEDWLVKIWSKSTIFEEKWWLRHFFACRRLGGDDSTFYLPPKGMYSDENTLFSGKNEFGAPPGIIAGVSRLFHPKIMLKLEIAWGRRLGWTSCSLTIGIVLDIVHICKYWRNIWHLFDMP